MDKILDFRKCYLKNKKSFSFLDSGLYSFFCEYYGLYDILIETCTGMVLVHKYNIIGYCEADDFFCVYESVGELDKKLWKVYFSNILTVSTI